MNSIEFFQRELTEYVMAAQSCMYVNTREESRVLSAIRRAGWALIPDPKKKPVHYDFESHKLPMPSQVAEALDHGQVNPKWFTDSLVLDGAKFIEAYDYLEKVIPIDDEDEERIAGYKQILTDVLNAYGFPTICYDSFSGFEDNGSCVKEFDEALSRIGSTGSSLPDQCLIVLKDLHMHLNSNESPIYRRGLRNLYEDNRLVSGKYRRHLIFVQRYLNPHADISHCMVKLRFDLPDDEQISREVTAAQQGIEDMNKRQCSPELREELVGALRGLDSANIATTLTKCLVHYSGFNPDMVRTVRVMRSTQLSSATGMRIIDPDDPELLMMGNLGGFENVFELLEDVKMCRSPEARQLNLPAPTGFGIAGPPGTGKTHCMKLTAHLLGVPLVVINMGTTKEGIVGASEANMALNLDVTRAIGDCVLGFDEWDKQSGGVVGSFSDGNTSGGMLSQVLDFASDPRRRAFLIFTMNRLHGPIESLRAGRISSFFYTPLPDEADRQEILTLKLMEQGAEIPKGLEKVASDQHTKGLSGSELNEMVNKALRLAFKRCKAKRPSVEEFIEARKIVTPVTQLNAEEVAAMEAFKGIAVPVSREKKQAKTVKQLSSGRRDIRFRPSDN